MYPVYTFLALFLGVMVWLWMRNRRCPPGPWGVPILGYLPWMDPKAPQKTLAGLAKIYGPVYGLYLGSVYTVVLSDVKVIRKVLAKEAAAGRAPLYLTHGIMKGCGIICAEGELWKDQRKFLNGCLKNIGMQKFGTKREHLQSVIMKEVVDSIKYIESENKPMEAIEAIRHNVASAVSAIVFGTSYDRNDESWIWRLDVQEEGVKDMGVAGPLNFLPFLRILPQFKNLMSRILKGQSKEHLVNKEIIASRRQMDPSQRSANIVDALLEEQEKRKGTPDVELYYNEKQMVYLLSDCFGAGLDTTLVTLCWYISFMAANRTEQKTLQDELDAVVQDRPVTLDDIAALPYLQASIAETQRIRSVVPLGFPHGTVTDMEIEGHLVPKGSMLVPFQWAVHMDEAAWKDPEEFNPSRFLNDEGKFFKPESFIPFQTGKRMCVGDDLANMLLYLFGANILHKFTIEPFDGETVDLEGIVGLTLSPKRQNFKFTARG